MKGAKVFDFYDLDKNQITKKDIFIENTTTIQKGQEIILYDKNCVIVDYIEFCDRNNQIVYSCLEQKIKNKI